MPAEPEPAQPDLKTRWYRLALERHEPGDAVYYAETEDPRVGGDRRVVVGALVDGRPEKPGLLLLSLTSDGHALGFGVSHPNQARALAMAMERAWPGVLSEALESRAARLIDDRCTARVSVPGNYRCLGRRGHEGDHTWGPL